MADVKLDTVLAMPFLIINNTDVNFQAQNLQWRSYTTGDVLPTTRPVELIGKKEFVAVALDLKQKTFVVYVAILSIDLSDKVHPLRKVQIAYLKADEAPTEVPSKYADFADVFLPKLAAKLLELKICNHAIK